jgi:hypothetical protein
VPRGENANSSLREPRSEISEYFVRRNRFNKSGIQRATSALNFIEQGMLGAGVRGRREPSWNLFWTIMVTLAKACET